MRRKIVVLLFCTAVLLTAAGVVLSQSAANFQLTWSVIAGGGRDSTSSDYRVEGTIGQSAAHSAAAGGNYQVEGGFWLPFAGVPASPGLENQLFLPVVMRGS
jgi:hypothetical protein